MMQRWAGSVVLVQHAVFKCPVSGNIVNSRVKPQHSKCLKYI